MNKDIRTLLYDIVDDLNTIQNRVFKETKSHELVDEFKKLKKKIELTRINLK